MPSPSGETVRLAVIGTGGIARTHLRALTSMPDVELAALCDLDAGRARVDPANAAAA